MSSAFIFYLQGTWESLVRPAAMPMSALSISSSSSSNGNNSTASQGLSFNQNKPYRRSLSENFKDRVYLETKLAAELAVASLDDDDDDNDKKDVISLYT
jgi:hypothetical protein